MQTLVFMPAARLEVVEAVDWYAKEAPNLSARLLAELDYQADRISANPFRFPLMLADVRRAKLRCFPYGLFFRPLEKTTYIIACFHSSRDPIVWQKRI
jgi:toxin ParE1/3/4